MTKVAVVAHADKTFGGGLTELREVLAAEGFPDPAWYEVSASRKAPKRVRRAVADGADLVFVWGGDGTVQRCIDAVAGTGTVIAILPAGTANLLATNLGVPADVADAVRVGLHGRRRLLDTGSVNGEHFAVMAGAGFDALMIKRADAGLKDRVGRVAYLWTGARNLNARRVKATVTVDGRPFFKGAVSCVLVANVGKVFGGIEPFSGARPDDGLLDLGVVTAKNPVQWARTLGRVALGNTEGSPFVETTRGSSFTIRFSRPFGYELDGGERRASTKLRIKVHPASVRICVPTEREDQPPDG
jgi:YegS/Rv2252/BmrU family lipid kinase